MQFEDLSTKGVYGLRDLVLSSLDSMTPIGSLQPHSPGFLTLVLKSIGLHSV